MDDRSKDLALKKLEIMTKIMEALPDMQRACERVMDSIFELLPAARVAILVKARPRDAYKGQKFVVELFAELGLVGETVRFTPRAEAIESACDQAKTYISPDSPRIVCAPVFTPDALRGAVYFESTGEHSEFIADQAECIRRSAEIVGTIVAQAEKILDLEEQRADAYEKLQKKYKMIGDGPAIRALQAGMRKAAGGDGPVLILGETKTGKEVTAFGIHDMSSRRGLAFRSLYCGNIDTGVLRKALLGDRPSFFWGPQGTVFLKALTQLALPLQKELLEILRDGKSPVRLMASTELDLDEWVAHDAFLPELAERLAGGSTLLVPPLRERTEDIPLLIQHFFKKHRHGYEVTGFSPEAVEILCSASWPHNLLNLDLGIDWAIMHCSSSVIGCEDLGEMLTQAPLLMSPEKKAADSERRLTANAVRRKAILRRLKENGGDADDAAVSLGVLPGIIQSVLKTGTV